MYIYVLNADGFVFILAIELNLLNGFLLKQWIEHLVVVIVYCGTFW